MLASAIVAPAIFGRIGNDTVAALKAPEASPPHGRPPQSRENVSSRSGCDRGGRIALAVGDAAPDPRLPPRLSTAGDDLFRLWRAGANRRQPRHVDQGAIDVEPGGARRHRRVAQPAVDRQNGVW